jgi:predicted nucleotidyltransferase component of viral defense system
VTDQTQGLSRSVHERLVRHAKEQGLDPTLVFTRYAIERFLYRLSESEHSDRFVLKGALLLYAWVGDVGRATRDADLLGLGDLSDEILVEIFRDICLQGVADDGMVFDPTSIRVSAIRVEDGYGGRRLTLTGHLGKGRSRVQVDVGLGDATVPEPEPVAYPTLLGDPAPHLRGYRPETVVAEKLHAIVHLGLVNTRMKDFYDLLTLAKNRTFVSHTMRGAIEATFARRNTVIPEDAPPGLSDEFATDGRGTQWRAFLERNELSGAPELDAVLNELRAFLGPVTWDGDHAIDAASWEYGVGWRS